MAVPVLDPDGHQADFRLQLPVQGRALISRSVVCDLDDVDGADFAGREERILSPFAQVAEKYRPETLAVDRKSDAATVAAERRLSRSGTRGPDHAPVHCSKRAGGSRVDLGDACAAASETVQHPGIPRTVRLADERLDGPADQGLVATDMVSVVVRENEDVDAGDAEPLQASGSGRGLPAYVDHQHRIAVANEQPISLAHVARRDLPIVGDGRQTTHGAASERSGVCERTGDQRGAGDHGDGAPHALRTQRQDEHSEKDEGAQRGPHRSPGPGKGAPGKALHSARHHRDPLRRRPGDPDDQLTEHGSDRQERAGDASEHCGERRRRPGEQIGRDPVERERRRQQDEDRLARELGGGRDRERQGERAGKPPAEYPGERHGEHEEPGGRQHRQGEPVVPGDPGVGDHHHDHGESERGKSLGGSAAGHPDEDDDRHRGGTENARSWCDEDDEGTESEQRSGDAEAPAGSSS